MSEAFDQLMKTCDAVRLKYEPLPPGTWPRGSAILYARVSTDEQARHGFSLAAQLEALRAYASDAGLRVVEEVVDAGESGATLLRPGLDHVRDLVRGGSVSVVLAQDRDRLSREPAHLYLLRHELEARGCRLRALNDREDASPEGELSRGVMDLVAKYERTKMAERSRRGSCAAPGRERSCPHEGRATASATMMRARTSASSSRRCAWSG